MRVFITGGAGFIGSHLADHYVNAGHQVTILDNFSTGSKTNIAHLQGIITTVDGDIRNIELAFGDGVKRVFESELPVRAKLRRN